jgi:hypothetical protein
MKPLKNINKDQIKQNLSKKPRPEIRDNLDSRKNVEIPSETTLFNRVDIKKKIERNNSN